MGGKKPIGAEPSRGNCRSRRGRHHDHSNNNGGTERERSSSQAGAGSSSATSSSASNEGNQLAQFSLFSGPEGLHSWLSKPPTTASSHPESGLVNQEQQQQMTTETELYYCKKEISELKERLEMLEAIILRSDSNVGGREGANKSPAPHIAQDSKDQKIRTLEGRQATMQSKFALLDGAFGGSATGAWHRGTKQLKCLLEGGAREYQQSADKLSAKRDSLHKELAADESQPQPFDTDPAASTAVDLEPNDVPSPAVVRSNQSQATKQRKKPVKKTSIQTQTMESGRSQHDVAVSMEPTTERIVYVPTFPPVVPMLPPYSLTPLAPYESYQYVPYASYGGYHHYDHYGSDMENFSSSVTQTDNYSNSCGTAASHQHHQHDFGAT
jgi:hypothetical protein